MNKYLALLLLLLVGLLLVMVGLNWIAYSGEQRTAASLIGSEAWCEAMMVKPDAEWSDGEARDFTNYCLFDKK